MPYDLWLGLRQGLDNPLRIEPDILHLGARLGSYKPT